MDGVGENPGNWHGDWDVVFDRNFQQMAGTGLLGGSVECRGGEGDRRQVYRCRGRLPDACSDTGCVNGSARIGRRDNGTVQRALLGRVGYGHIVVEGDPEVNRPGQQEQEHYHGNAQFDQALATLFGGNVDSLLHVIACLLWRGQNKILATGGGKEYSDPFCIILVIIFGGVADLPGELLSRWGPVARQCS